MREAEERNIEMGRRVVEARSEIEKEGREREEIRRELKQVEEEEGKI